MACNNHCSSWLFCLKQNGPVAAEILGFFAIAFLVKKLKFSFGMSCTLNDSFKYLCCLIWFESLLEGTLFNTNKIDILKVKPLLF